MQSILLYFFLSTLPFERLLTFDIVGYTLKLSYLVGFVLIIYYLVSKKISIKKIQLEDWLILALIALSVVTSVWSLDPKRTIILSVVSAFSILMYLIVKQAKLDKQKIIEIIIWLGLGTSLFGYWQFFGDSFGLSQHFTFLRSEYVKGVFPFPRVQSTFLEPLFFANFLIAPIYLSIIKYLDTRNRKYLLYLSVIGLSFFLTLSRGAFYGLIGSAVVSLILILLFAREKLFPFVQSISVVLLSFLFSLFLIFSVSQKDGLESYITQAQKTSDQNIQTVGNQGLSLRSYTQKVAIEESKNHLFGIGFGSFGTLSQFSPILKTGNHQTVNNQYLEILAELGVLGIILYLAFWAATLFKLFIFSKENFYGIFFIGICTAWLIQYLSFSAFNLLYLWVALGFIGNYIRKRI